jgi:hypothetical protein
VKEHKSSLVARENNDPEKIVAKDNHGFDAWTYSLDFRPLLFKKIDHVPDHMTVKAFIQRSERARNQASRSRRGIIVA